MKTRLLIIFVLLFAILLTAGFSSVEESYLPTSISLRTSGKFDKELLFNLRASLGNRKIKTISKEEALELQKTEIERLARPYFENLKKTGATPNFDEYKFYMSSNQHKVCNSLTVDINVTDDGIIKDTIKWHSITLPIDFLNLHKPNWHILILDTTSKASILKITQTIVDSIIASNVLVRQ